MRYLGIEPKRPRVAVFEFTSCEGCELQLANKEDTLAAFLGAVEIVRFREISSHQGESWDVAFIEGAISRGDEFSRLMQVRERSNLLVALGSCACFGGVNHLKNAFGMAEANDLVYGDEPKETLPVRPIRDVVPVDMEIPGCPVDKRELEHIVQHLAWDIPFSFPEYPVCFECKQRFTVCAFDRGEMCLGPVTRGGCRAPCPAGGLGCWGCRGPATDANVEAFLATLAERGFAAREVAERFDFFGGFKGLT